MLWGPLLTTCDDFILRVFCFLTGFHTSKVYIPFLICWAIFSILILSGTGLPSVILKDDLIAIYIIKNGIWVISIFNGYLLAKAIRCRNISKRAGIYLSITTIIYIFITLVGSLVYYVWLQPYGIIPAIISLLAASVFFYYSIVKQFDTEDEYKPSAMEVNRISYVKRYFNNDRRKIFAITFIPNIILLLYMLLQPLKIINMFGTGIDDYTELLIQGVISIICVGYFLYIRFIVNSGDNKQNKKKYYSNV